MARTQNAPSTYSMILASVTGYHLGLRARELSFVHIEPGMSVYHLSRFEAPLLVHCGGPSWGARRILRRVRRAYCYTDAPDHPYSCIAGLKAACAAAACSES